MSNDNKVKKRPSIFDNLPENYEHVDVCVMGNLREQFNFDEVRKDGVPVYLKFRENNEIESNETEDVKVESVKFIKRKFDNNRKFCKKMNFIKK